ncbi:putative copia-type protein [Senna tora]|uniref:Putative copia-type protein n=1 Tax=Senna tora TaxID=362788 RepID=A0A834T334_9FABA|nr:putative copia-type protein [Senna tora]
MAASSASSSSSASSAVSVTSPSSKPCPLSSSSSQATSVKLDRGNYLLWESVVLSLIEGNQLEAHINGSSSAPPQLLTFESRLDQNNNFSSLTVQPSVNAVQKDEASQQNNHGGWRGGPNNRGSFHGGRRGGRGGGRPGGQNTGSGRPFCHLCEKQGHIVSDCYFRFDKTFQPPKWQNSGSSSNNGSASAQAFYATPQVVDDPSWYVDSGATHHVTPHSNQLDYYTPVGKVLTTVKAKGRIAAALFLLLVTAQRRVESASETGHYGEHFDASPTANVPTVVISPTTTAGNNPRGSTSVPSDLSVSASRDNAHGLGVHSSGSSSDSIDQSTPAQDSSAQHTLPNTQVQQHHHMVTRARDGIYKPRYPYVGLLQSETSENLLRKFHMSDCAPVSTPMVTGKSYSKDEGTTMTDLTLYRQAVGSLQYLTTTRPDISYSVNKLSQYMASPTDEHFQGVKRIFRYLKGTHNVDNSDSFQSKLDLRRII